MIQTRELTVVTQSTNEKSHVYSVDKDTYIGSNYKPYGYVEGKDDSPALEQFTCQDVTQNIYLYFVSNEFGLSVGDWVFRPGGRQPFMITDADSADGLKRTGCVKIFATTDPSLNLPLISADFQKIFCESGGVSKVLVEFEQEYRVESLDDYDTDLIIRNCSVVMTLDKDDDYVEEYYISIDENGVIVGQCDVLEFEFVQDVLVPLSIIKDVIKYCESQQIYDKLGGYGDFYYKLKALNF